MKTDHTCVFLPHVKHKNWQHMWFSSSCQTWKLTTHVFFFMSYMKTVNTCVLLPHVKHENWHVFFFLMENWQHKCFSSSCKTWKLTTHVFFFLMSNMKTDNTCVFLPHVKHENWQHMCFSSLHLNMNTDNTCFSSSDKHENWQQMCFSYSCQTWKLTTNVFFFLWQTWKLTTNVFFLLVSNMKTDNKCVFLPLYSLSTFILRCSFMQLS